MSDQVLGTIKGISNLGLSILIDGEIIPTIKNYLFIDSYHPGIDDRVLISKIGSSYVVLGKVGSSLRDNVEMSFSILNNESQKKMRFFSYESGGKRNGLWVKQDGDSGWFCIK